MTILARATILLLVYCLVLNYAVQVQAAEEGKYGQWQSTDNQIEKMINELDLIIEEGINARAAHPDFLKDLQKTIDQYRTPTKIVYFSDNFADSDFSSNPTWTVNQGEYSIDRHGSLYSSVAIRRPSPQEETGAESSGDRSMRVLLGVLNELAKDDKDQQSGTDKSPDQAVIFSNGLIPNSFILQFSFRSTSSWGGTSIGVFQGDDLKTGYHLVYQASPAENRPMHLVRYRYSKPYIVDEVRENSPDLDDGLDHNIQFMRDSNGDMVVTVDGKEVLRSSDLSYQDDFAGIAITNSGGSYAYDNIEFFSEQ
jgi:hypothetical protein